MPMPPPSTIAPPTPALRTLQLGMGWLPEQPGNGLDRMYHNLVRTLPDVGVGVNGLVMGSPDVAPSSGGTVTAAATPSASLPTRLRILRQRVRQQLAVADIDMVATHFALYAAPVLDLLGDRPLVVHFHGPWALESRAEGAGWLQTQAKKALERHVYRRATRCIVLSKAFREVLTEEYGVEPDRIDIVPGGVDIDRFDTGESVAQARAHLGWPPDRPIVLAVRRLAHRMGLEALIDAVADIRTTVPDVLLYIAGTGPLHNTLTRRIAEAGLTDHIRLLGFVPDTDLPLAYRAATLSVVPTVALEGFGLITIESLAAGTPVLVTPVGGLPEVVSPLSTALVLDAATPAALAEGLTEALTGTRSLPSTLTCQTYAQQHFGWPAIARRTRSVYESVLV